MKKDVNKYIGKYVMTFLPEGCAPSSFAKNTITRTFANDGEMGKFIEEMMERGYVFEDAWTHEVYWKDFKARYPDSTFWDESYNENK